jgi:colanic acid biosynthesis glycosyl transferase WcaI
MSRELHIYGINYWPETTGIAPYTTAVARALAERDWRVTVHTGLPHYPQWEVAAEYASVARWVDETDGDVAVRRYRHYVPAHQSALRRAAYEATFLANGRNRRGLGRPDLILGIVPALSSGLLARAAAARHRVPYGLLVQDLMGNAADQSGVRGGERVARLIRSVEGRIARGAERVGVVAEGFRPHLEAMGVAADRIDLLPNWSHVAPPAGDRTRTRADLGWDDTTQIVLHAGNMGLKQGLEHVIAAARLAQRQGRPVRFVLMGDGSQRGSLETLAIGAGNVQFLPPQPADRFMDLLAAADVLLVNERGSVTDMSLPSKLTSYFVTGRPVVAATNPISVTSREVLRSGAGLTVAAEDPGALLAALDQLRLDPELARRLGASGPIFAETHLSAQAAYHRTERFLSRMLPISSPRVFIGGGVPMPINMEPALDAIPLVSARSGD